MVTDEEYLELQNAYNALLDEHFDQRSSWISHVSGVSMNQDSNGRMTFHVETPEGHLEIEAYRYTIHTTR